MTYVSVLQAQAIPDILPQVSIHLQEGAQRTAMRKLQEIEEQSRIQGNRYKRDILNDPGQLDAFLQDFTVSHQDIVRVIWMREKDKVDEKYLKLYGKSETASGEAASSSQSGSRRVNHADKHEDDNKDDCDSESDAEASLLGHDESSYTSEQSRPSKLSRFLKSKLKSELMVAVLGDRDNLERYLQKFTSEEQNLARESWFAVLELADHRLEKVTSQISLFAADNGELNDTEDDVEMSGTQRYGYLY